MKIQIVKDFNENIVQTGIEMDVPEQYAQIYEILEPLSYKVHRPISFHFLFWAIKNMSKENTLIVALPEKQRFCDEVFSKGGPAYKPRSVEQAIKELIAAEIMTRTANGRYQMSAFLVWKDNVKKRYEQIKQEMTVMKQLPESIHDIKIKSTKKFDQDG